MAYTYEDFTRAAAQAGLAGSFDEEDMALAQKYPEYGLSLVSLKRDLGNAQTNEQRLLVSEATNQLRSRYASYSEPAQTGTAEAAATASSAAESAQEPQTDYQRLLSKVVSYEPFDYDPTQDPIYSSYKKAYNREGDRAAANALAQASAATGGRPSSYAATAAQQADNYYAGKLADIIPTLRGQAMDEYSSEYSQLLQGLSAAYQQERDKIEDERAALEDALRVYQLTKRIKGPLAEYLGVGTGGGSGGGGGAYYGGGGSGGGTGADGHERIGDGEQLQSKALDADSYNDMLMNKAYAILDKYDYYGADGERLGSLITDPNDYALVKMITGLDDATLEAAGIHDANSDTYGLDAVSGPATTRSTGTGKKTDWAALLDSLTAKDPAARGVSPALTATLGMSASTLNSEYQALLQQARAQVEAQQRAASLAGTGWGGSGTGHDYANRDYKQDTNILGGRKAR